MKTLEELKKTYAEKEAELKKEKLEAMKKAKARAAKKEAAERAAIRKQDSHIKIIIGGFVLAEFKKNGNLTLFDTIIENTKNEKDKDLLTKVKNSIALQFQKGSTK